MNLRLKHLFFLLFLGRKTSIACLLQAREAVPPNKQNKKKEKKKVGKMKKTLTFVECSLLFKMSRINTWLIVHGYWLSREINWRDISPLITPSSSSSSCPLVVCLPCLLACINGMIQGTLLCVQLDILCLQFLKFAYGKATASVSIHSIPIPWHLWQKHTVLNSQISFN